MNSKSIKYRDTWAAPGSQLHAALEAGDRVLAEKLYQQGELDARNLLEQARYRNWDSAKVWEGVNLRVS